MEVLAVGGAPQVEDRVAHQLAGPVERHVAAALHLDHVDALRAEHVRPLGGAAQGDHGRVLEQQQ